MRNGARLVLVLWLLAAAACASGAARAPGASRPRRDQSAIRFDELRESHSTDLLTAVLSLRPYWLNKRGSKSGEVIVYVDNMRYGPAQSLRAIDVSVVDWLQYLNGPEASARFGMGHPHGAILVYTRRGEREPD